MRLISVVMGEPETSTRNSETTNLINYGFSNYSIEKVLTTKSVVGKAKVYQGQQEYVELIPTRNVNILNNKNEEKRNVTYEVDVKEIKSPIKIGDIVGTLNILEDNKIIDKIDVTVKENVKKANLFKLYLRYLKNVLSGNIEL